MLRQVFVQRSAYIYRICIIYYSVRQWPKKSAFMPLQIKLCVGSKNDCHLLELSRGCLSACKVWGDRTTRAGCIRAKISVFCMSRLVCLRVGDIGQVLCDDLWVDFDAVSSAFYGMDCSFRCTT